LRATDAPSSEAFLPAKHGMQTEGMSRRK